MEVSEEMRANGFVGVFSGPRINLFDDEWIKIPQMDVVQSIARICRYNGHVKNSKYIYSVARHSTILAQALIMECAEKKMDNEISNRLALLALMHDCKEAIIQDWMRGLINYFKVAAGPSFEKAWDDLNDKADKYIYELFGVETPTEAENKIISTYDSRIIIDECRTVRGNEVYESSILDPLNLSPSLFNSTTVQEDVHAFCSLYENITGNKVTR